MKTQLPKELRMSSVYHREFEEIEERNLSEYSCRNTFGRNTVISFIKGCLIISQLLLLLLSNPKATFAQVVPPPTPPGTPKITLDVPSQVLIGTDFKFKVTFENPPGNTFGYGPFVDLILEASGANKKDPSKSTSCVCDGITFVKARLVDVNAPVDLVTYEKANTKNCGVSSGIVTHPYEANGIDPVPVSSVQIGGQLITLEIPFGSFDPTQSNTFTIEVTAHVDINADVNVPLEITARGGYRYGSTPTDDHLTDDPMIWVSPWLLPPDSKLTTPTVIIVNKVYMGPENENATGPNFANQFLGYSNGYPLRYKITVDVAPGQTVTDVLFFDDFPGNMTFEGTPSPTLCPSTGTWTPPLPGPGGTLQFGWPSLSGATCGIHTASMEYQFFIPDKDINNNPVLPSDCSPTTSVNDLRLTYKWQPVDICDQMKTDTAVVKVDDHTLLNKCIAIQKYHEIIITADSVLHPIPGDVVKYTLNFQVSDYKTATDIVIRDVLYDGQMLITPSGFPSMPAPTLTVKDQFGTCTSTFLEAELGTTWLKVTNDSLNECVCYDSTGGRESITFLVSKKIIDACGTMNSRYASGILTGGAAAGAPPSTTPASGEIVFYALILDRFRLPHAGDPWVDKDDPMYNCVCLTANILQNEIPPVVPTFVECQATDDSKATFSISSDNITKTVYMVKRNGVEIWGPNTTTTPSIPDVTAGDEVTFRIEKMIPSSDFENLTIRDWLSLPIFDVTNPEALPTSPSWTWSSPTHFNPSTNCGAPPAPGYACAPLPTVHLDLTTWQYANTINYPPWLRPIINSDPVTNSLTFNYYSMWDDANIPRKIDLLFTLTAKNNPFADGLYLTNEVQECETNTFGKSFCKTAIAQVRMAEPNVRITKGVVATDNDRGQISPPVVAPIAFALPGESCPRFSGTIHSNYLANNPLNGNISNVDANDRVTFAIIAENVGSGPNGAFDVKISDIWPEDTTCFIPDALSLCVTYGDGTPISLYGGFPSALTTYIVGWSSNSFTIELVDPTLAVPPQGSLAPLNQNTQTSGKNIVVITFDARIPSNIIPGCCENLASLTNYSNTENGPDFVDAGFGNQFEDGATMCVLPIPTKSIDSTSELHTFGSDVTIGEIVRYRIEVVVPEGASGHYILQDALPLWMKFLNDGTAMAVLVSNGGLTSVPPLPTAAGDESTVASIQPQLPLPLLKEPKPGFQCGAPAIFDLGILSNTENDNNQEFIVLEFNALVCNVIDNVDGITLTNTIHVIVDDVDLSQASVTATIVEPNLTIEKSDSPISVVKGEIVEYTVTIKNTGTATAKDVGFVEPPSTWPGGLILDDGSFTVTTTLPTGTSIGLTSQYINSQPFVMSWRCDSLPINGEITIKYNVQAYPEECPDTLINYAKVVWTSLPHRPFSFPGPPIGAANQGTCPNPTGSCITDPGSGSLHGERGYGGGVNDYLSSDTASLIVKCPECATPPDSMVAWWTLDEQNGSTVVKDIVGYHNSEGKPINNGAPTTLGVPNAPVSVLGKVAGAVLFTRPNYVEVQNHTDVNFKEDDFSIDAWIKPASCSNPLGYIWPIVDKYDAASNTGYSLYLIEDQNLGAVLTLRINNVIYSGGVVAPNTWSHVAVSVSRSQPSFLFINGVAQSIPAAGGPMIPLNSVDNNLPLWIGGNKGYASNPRCEISIDELEFFKRALDPTEVKAIWLAADSGKCRYDLAITKVAIGTPWTVGDKETFTIQGYNVGEATLPPGTVITIIDPLPAGLTLTGVLTGSPPWSVTPQTGTGTITCTYTVPSPGILPGNPLPLLTFEVTVTECKTLRNCATITAKINGSVMLEPMDNNQDCIVIQTNCCYPPPLCMFNWWTFDEDAGGLSNDIRGQNNAGTWFGSPTPVQGMVSKALEFNGTNSVVVTDHPELNYGYSDFSIDFWIRVDAADANKFLPILDKRAGPANSPVGYHVYILNGRLGLQLGDGAPIVGSDDLYESTKPIADGMWHHIAVTVDRDNPYGVRWYIDGVYDNLASIIWNPDPTTNTGSLNNTANLLIGKHAYYANASFKGILDELETFCCVLSEADILGIYAAGSAGKCKLITGIDYPGVPKDFELFQNYPNPFNPSTTIEYAIPWSAHIKLVIYDIYGREVTTLVDETQAPGRHSVSFNADKYKSGVYIYRLYAGGFTATKKMLLLK